MSRCRSRLVLLSVVACLTACATTQVPEKKTPLGVPGIPPPVSQPAGTPKPQATSAAPVVTIEGRPIATELPPEVKRLIDGMRRLHEQPGLILDREAIYEALGVKVTESKSSRSTEGSRSMGEGLAFVRSQEYPNWRGALMYSEFPESESWNVSVELSYDHGPICYPSRLVESYWGKPFVYRPFGVHAFRRELQRKQRGMPPTEPHDGEPYITSFSAPHANSASVSFFVAPGGCLSTVRAIKLFKVKEYSDDHVYHQ